MKKFVPFLLLVVLLLTVGGATNVRAQQPGETISDFAFINGALIHYEITGQGEPLLLIHGYPLNGDLFVRQREALSQRFRVITIDQRGFGLSEAPGPRASAEIYARDAIDLLRLLRIQRAVIGGHSLGGIVALTMYRLAPERFSGLILNGTIARSAPPAERQMWRGYAEQARTLGGPSLLPLSLPIFLTGQTRRNNPALVEEVAGLALQASPEGLVGGALALANRPDNTDVLPTISVPTLIIFGEEDALYSFEVGQMLNAAIPNSELVIIPGGAHGVIRERAEPANEAILDFANRRLASASDAPVN